MKQVALLLVIISLIISIAAPAGAAFALDEVTEPVAPEETELLEQVSEPEQSAEQSAPIEEAKIVAGPEIVDTPPETPEANISTVEPPAVVTPPAAPIVPEPVTIPPLIITTFDVSDGLEFVELYNQSDTPIAASDVRLQASSGGEQCSTGINDSGFIMPSEFFYVRSPSYLPGHFERTLTGECLVSNTIVRLELFTAEHRVQLIDGINLQSSWGGHKSAWSKNARKTFSSAKQSGSFADDYVLVGGGELYSSSTYLPPVDTSDLAIVEVLPSSRSCAPDDAGEDCDDYIKVYNSSAEDMNLALFRLRTGSRSANATLTSSFNWHESTLHPARDELILPAGAYFTLKLRNDGVPLSLSNGEGNVWLEDYYGVMTYQSMSYQGMDLAAARGKSWAYDAVSAIWQFGVPSPGRANVLYVPEEEAGKGAVGEELQPCGPNQYRSEDTNRCRTIASSSMLTPCREGQYRSEETNRCRSIATAAAAVLKPCADDQFRNPETNRCKKIAGADDLALADCGEGRERNPETNRCRNVLGVSTLADTVPFPVEKTEEGDERFIGWWTIGIVAAAGAVYGVWEWREELAQLGRRAGKFISRSK
jgi:hypothetical protein